MNHSYGPLATEVYQRSKSVEMQFPDTPYYIKQLKKMKGKILEAGVGNGRMLIPLLKEKLDVVGVDNSDDMLAACRSNLKKHKLKATLYNQSLLELNLKERFDAIIMPVGSFMLFDSFSDAAQVLENFYAHLNPKGKIFIDIGTPSLDLELEGQKLHRSTIERQDGSFILVENTLQYRILDQVEEILIRYEDWRDSKLVNTELQVLPLRWWGMHEFSMLLEKTGFGNIQVCADHEPGVMPTDENTYLCFTASKS